MFSGVYRTFIRNVPLDYLHMEHPRFPHASSRPGGMRRLFSGNILGHIFIDYSGKSFNGSNLILKCLLNSAVSGTQTTIALKCYHMKTGELPETLGELIPEYMPRIPPDDFDGNPIKYSKTDRLVYSHGKILHDGATPDLVLMETYIDPRNMEPPVYPVTFD